MNQKVEPSLIINNDGRKKVLLHTKYIVKFSLDTAAVFYLLVIIMLNIVGVPVLLKRHVACKVLGLKVLIVASVVESQSSILLSPTSRYSDAEVVPADEVELTRVRRRRAPLQ